MKCRGWAKVSEYQERICLKCGKPFQEHFTMGSRALCPKCFFGKPALEPHGACRSSRRGTDLGAKYA